MKFQSVFFIYFAHNTPLQQELYQTLISLSVGPLLPLIPVLAQRLWN